MAERGKYKTRQQEVILAAKNKIRFLTVNQLYGGLEKDNITVGYTTVYRALERLEEEGKVIKLPTEDGTKTRYCFAEKEILGKPGKLVCLKCKAFFYPLECSRLEAFFDHISEEHGFELDRHHMILYGYCGCCKKEKNSRDFA